MDVFLDTIQNGAIVSQNVTLQVTAAASHRRDLSVRLGYI